MSRFALVPHYFLPRRCIRDLKKLKLHRRIRRYSIQLIGLMVGFAVVANAADIAAAESSVGHPVAIAVLPFTSSVNTDFREKLPQFVTDKLVNEGKFAILERDKLDQILGELEFHKSTHVDPATAVNIGKMIGAQLIVTGDIIEYSSSSSKSTAYEIETNISNYFLSARVEVVNIETGQKIFSQIVNDSAEQRRTGVHVVGKGPNSLGNSVAEKVVGEMLASQSIQRLINDDSAKEPALVSITVISDPIGADVEIDGIYVGQAGGPVEVVAGEHDIKISAPNLEPWVKRIVAKEGIVVNARLR